MILGDGEDMVNREGAVKGSETNMQKGIRKNKQRQSKSMQTNNQKRAKMQE